MPPLNDNNALYAFFLVLTRCTATFITAPVFGAQNVPPQIRLFLSLAIGGSLALVVQPTVGPAPLTVGLLFVSLANEIAAGVLIGLLMQFVLQIATMAGSFLDMQVGLSMSQTMNPATGVSVTILGQFKSMLAMVIFLSMNGHHLVIQAISKSYAVAPTLTAADAGILQTGIPQLVGQGSLLAMQIAAPVLGVSIIVDAALGAMAKAIPQLQPIQLGMPAKLGAGIMAVSLTLPALVTATQKGVGLSMDLIMRVFSR